MDNQHKHKVQKKRKYEQTNCMNYEVPAVPIKKHNMESLEIQEMQRSSSSEESTYISRKRKCENIPRSCERSELQVASPKKRKAEEEAFNLDTMLNVLNQLPSSSKPFVHDRIKKTKMKRKSKSEECNTESTLVSTLCKSSLQGKDKKQTRESRTHTFRQCSERNVQLPDFTKSCASMERCKITSHRTKWWLAYARRCIESESDSDSPSPTYRSSAYYCNDSDDYTLRNSCCSDDTL